MRVSGDGETDLGDQGNEDGEEVFAADTELELTKCLEERHAFDVAHHAAQLEAVM